MTESQNTHTLAEFQHNAGEFVRQIKETNRPLVLTVEGKAEAVLQSAESYQQLLDQLESAETVAGLRQAIAEFDRGEAQPARQALEALRRKHGISG